MVFNSAMYPQQHIKSPKKSHYGKLPKNGIYYEALRPVLRMHGNEADLNFSYKARAKIINLVKCNEI